MRELTVATVQMKPELGSVEENLGRMSETISRIATQQPVNLIIFPELVTTGYEAGPRFPQLAQRVPGPAVNVIAQRAADFGVHVAFGMVTKEKVESILYNSAILIGPEGDFTPAELSLAKSAGCLPLSLGPLVLRAETAAIYALSILHHELQNR